MSLEVLELVLRICKEKDVLEKTLEQHDAIKAYAKLLRIFYNALREEGFERQDALSIITKHTPDTIALGHKLMLSKTRIKPNK